MNQVPANRKLSIAEELSKRVRAFKKKRPNLSSQQIAKRFDISASSLNRIENMDIKTPSFDQIVKILRGTGNEDDIISYIEGNYPELSETVKKHYRSTRTKGKVSQNFTDALKNPASSRILLLILCRPITTLDFIQSNFGLDGIKIVKKLQLAKLIQITNGTIYAIKNERLGFNTINDTKDVSSTLLNHYFDIDGANDFVAENHLTLEVSAIEARKAMPLINDILNEAKVKIQELTRDENMKGDDVMYLTMASDTLIPNNIQYQSSRVKEKLQ